MEEIAGLTFPTPPNTLTTENLEMHNLSIEQDRPRRDSLAHPFHQYVPPPGDVQIEGDIAAKFRNRGRSGDKMTLGKRARASEKVKFSMGTDSEAEADGRFAKDIMKTRETRLRKEARDVKAAQAAEELRKLELMLAEERKWESARNFDVGGYYDHSAAEMDIRYRGYAARQEDLARKDRAAFEAKVKASEECRKQEEKAAFLKTPEGKAWTEEPVLIGEEDLEGEADDAVDDDWELL